MSIQLLLLLSGLRMYFHDVTTEKLFFDLKQWLANMCKDPESKYFRLYETARNQFCHCNTKAAEAIPKIE